MASGWNGQRNPIMNSIRPLTTLLFALTLAACTAEDKKKSAMETKPVAPADPTGKVFKTDEEWKKQLTPEQYRILRKSGTERANGQAYQDFKHQGTGTYHCAGCNALLFSSDQKFDAGCGWPSFYDPAKAENVTLKEDTSMGTTRIEVNCAKCDGHLGHVFKGEGYNTPTDQRFCINGVGLVYVPAEKK